MSEAESLDLSDTDADHTLSGSSVTSSEFDDELQVSYKPVLSSNDDTHITKALPQCPYSKLQLQLR